MPEIRPRDAAQTRADILAAARRRFAAEGFERTTLRAIASDVGVDAALVIRYFGSKQDLFATATEFRIDLPDLSGADPDDIADMLLPRYFAVWEDDEAFLALLRAAMTSRVAADTLNETLATHVAPTLMGATQTEMKRVSAMRKKMTMCPATMLAKRRTVSAKGLVKSPSTSTGIMIG